MNSMNLIHRYSAFPLLAGLLWIGSGPLGRAAVAKEPSPDEIDFFEKQIRPLLTGRCYECHSVDAKKIQGGLLLDSRAGLIKGGKSGPVIVPGQPENSLLIKAVRDVDEDLQTPPHHRLSPGELANLKAWIKMGAPDPRAEKAPTTAAAPYSIDWKKARTFWSFQPVKDPTPPAVTNRRSVKTPVDQFILARLSEKGLAPAPSADKRTLIRRATFDLTGLPPTPGEVRNFLADQSPEAFEKVVDRLLASPHYGERWGRHWLDVARYADTSGCNSDYPIPDAYKYRNYVIESFNRDKPYDQFLREQVAGDLLPATPEKERFERIIATGYLAIARRFGSGASEFHLTIEDTIDNLGKAVLGLSVSCARCHDHKFDPVTTRDYYALYGIFNSTRYAFPGTELYKHPKDLVPLASPSEAEEYYQAANEVAELDQRIEQLLEKKRAFERMEKPAAKAEDGKAAPQGEHKDKDKAPEYSSVVEVKAALEDARNRQKLLENKSYRFDKAFAVWEGKPANARIQKKGDPKMPGDEVPRGFLEILGGQTLPAACTISGRLQLAQWLTDPQNPLTARVMVNRIWQHHFGKGIVPTPNDFGARGKPPTHPELLDYLAARFVQAHWSVKAMHKLIMLSSAYQMSSQDDPRNAAIDANNDWLWRFNRRRLDAEEVRDAMLAISGDLDPTMGGPHPFPPEHEWKYTQHKAFIALYPSNRRTVYLMQQRIRKHPFLEVFDGADPNATTAERPITTTPIQALFMMNDAFAHEQADKFAVRIGLAVREDRDRIDYACRLAFGRPATSDEIQLGEEYLRDCAAALKETELPADQQGRAALASYARVLFSSNEFIYVD